MICTSEESRDDDPPLPRSGLLELALQVDALNRVVLLPRSRAGCGRDDRFNTLASCVECCAPLHIAGHQVYAALLSARKAGVRQFVFISFPEVTVRFPLQDAKRAVEQALIASGMTYNYTILQPTFFMEFWLSPALGFDAVAGKAQIFGTGERPISWISYQDVARFAAASVKAPAARNAVIKLGGPEALTPLRVVEEFERVSGRRFSVDLCRSHR